jgi:uncharacterized protein YdeI (YjbR/CyaY-like superfamily)
LCGTIARVSSSWRRKLEAAFAEHPDLRARFDALAFTRRRELADPVAEARRQETRAARVERALDRLRALD